MHMLICIYIYIQSDLTGDSTHTHIYKYINIDIYVYIHTYIYAYIDTQIYRVV